MDLQDKVAVVTGAARGIGQAIALRFGQEGARVAIVDLREGEGRETVRLIEGAGGQADALSRTHCRFRSRASKKTR